MNLFYLEESIKTYESLIDAFNQRREVLLARRQEATGPILNRIDESLRLNDAAKTAMESALKSAQESFSVAKRFTPNSAADENQSLE